MKSIVIKNAQVVNRGKIFSGDVLVEHGRIARVDGQINVKADIEIAGDGKYLIPGIVDDQVHFREPGFPHKANIASESRAAVSGGVTTFMEMPNTKPATITQELLADKYAIAAKTSLANYSFFMGASNDNLEEVLKTDAENVCGVKVFMGSSTGNMLVDDVETLEKLFSRCPMLIATHCEDEQTIRDNYQWFYDKYGDKIKPEYHPLIRNEEACYKSSAMAVELARKYKTRLHILHLTTETECSLFDNAIPLKDKRITSEVCIHHLFFNSSDYRRLGNQIKCNPAIKGEYNQSALWQALLDDRLDIIATDHAPHTWKEKQMPYASAPAGLPLVQHALQIMLGFYHQGKISLERIVEKMCHAPAICFSLRDRGFIDEGMFADLALVDVDQSFKVQKDNLLYKCGWSPLEGYTFRGKVDSVVVSGHLALHNGLFNTFKMGERVQFNRP